MAHCTRTCEGKGTGICLLPLPSHARAPQAVRMSNVKLFWHSTFERRMPKSLTFDIRMARCTRACEGEGTCMSRLTLPSHARAPRAVRMSNVKLFWHSTFECRTSNCFDVRHLNVECQTTNVKPTSVPYKIFNKTYATDGTLIRKETIY